MDWVKIRVLYEFVPGTEDNGSYCAVLSTIYLALDIRIPLFRLESRHAGTLYTLLDTCFRRYDGCTVLSPGNRGNSIRPGMRFIKKGTIIACQTGMSCSKRRFACQEIGLRRSSDKVILRPVASAG